MPTARSLSLLGCLSLIPVLLLSACGGGGSSKTTSPQAGNLVNPAASYAGVSSPAVATSTNSESIALGSFGGTAISSFLAPTSAGKNVAEGNEVRMHQMSLVLKQSLRAMSIPGKAAQRRQAQAAQGKRVQRSSSYQSPGPEGGSVSFTLDINDATGSFYGSLDFQGYTSKGIAVTGTADMLGTFDATSGDFSRVTLSFRSLSMANTSYSCSLTGWISWGFNITTAAETQSMDMVLAEPGSSYWFNNYETFTSYHNGTQTQTISGRYYDSNFGHVDFTTTTPLEISFENPFPNQGSVQFSGGQGSSIRLSFLGSEIHVEADTDGNGSTDWQTTIAIQPPPPNSQPIAEGGADQSVTQLSQVLLNGSGSSDSDGDPLSYTWGFVSCPNNSCPSLTGADSATPSFSAEQLGSYELQLIVNDGQASSYPDYLTVNVGAPAPGTPNLLTEQWQYGSYGASIGQAGLISADLDGDGIPEIIASASAQGFGSNAFWYIAGRNADGSYRQIWRSNRYSSTIVSLSLTELPGTGKAVIVALADGTVLSYDSVTRIQLDKRTLAAPMAALAIADLEGDGSKEVVTSDGVGLRIYSFATGELKWSLASGGGSSLAVGKVDDDPALEIVTTGYGGQGFIIDGVSRSVDWQYVNGFGAKVQLADLQGDAKLEIVGASAWYKITIFDGALKSPLWEIATDLDIDAVTVADASGDGVPEIIYGDRQSGGLHAIDAATHLQKWYISNYDGGISGIGVADLDLDGSQEVFWGAGGYSTGGDYLYVADPLTGAIKWKSVDVTGPWSALAVGDVDDDGEDEVLMISGGSDSGYNEGVIHIFNARTHALKYQAKLGIRDWMGVRSVQIGDVDGDGKSEFVVTTGDLYDGVIRVYNGNTGALKRQSAGYNGNFFSALALGDLDGDGKTEIVAGQGREHTGARGIYLVVFDGDTLQEKWRSIDLGISWEDIYDLKLADLDSDGNQEIIASVSGARLVVFDGVTHQLKAMLEIPARALEVADVDGDGVRELLVGRTDGRIDVLNGTTFSLMKSVASFGGEAIDALTVADLAGAGSGEWLVTRGGKLVVLDRAGALEWTSGDLSAGLGLYNHLGVKDTDLDGRQDIFLGSSQALFHFE